MCRTVIVNDKPVEIEIIGKCQFVHPITQVQTGTGKYGKGTDSFIYGFKGGRVYRLSFDEYYPLD